jgi:hypothetical protein
MYTGGNNTTGLNNPLSNGITIFPGGAPLYKDGHLVGAIGISGDGVDQDDLITFAGTNGFRAPTSIRDDNLSQSTVVSFVEGKITQLADMPDLVFPTIAFLEQNANFGDPDSLFPADGLNITTGPLAPDNADILDRIMARLEAKGLEGVQLPFQKFPRNPGL